MTPDLPVDEPALSTSSLPGFVSDLVDDLMGMSGVEAVVLGGSRALGTHDDQSDWDLGVYYRAPLDLTRLEARGSVYPPGSWGRLMNGGAWLQVQGTKVDVLLRDLDAVEHWRARAEEGQFEIDALLGYAAGAPTYLLCAELASCRLLRGRLPSAPYPDRLRAAGPGVWRFCRTFSLDYARTHARRANVVGATAQAAKAVFEEAHAVLCERGRWVCNEKHLIDDAGLSPVQVRFGHVPSDSAGLLAWIDGVARHLDARGDEARPWSQDHRGISA